MELTSLVYTIHTRLNIDDNSLNWLNDYLTLYNKLERKMYRDVINGVVDKFDKLSEYISFFVEKIIY